MLKIDPTIRLQEEVICSELKKLKTTVERFRLPYTQEQVYTMLRGACRAEVEHRGREFKCTEQFDDHLRSVTQWLTTSGTTFGLFLCGSIGNGKTTFLRALQSLVNLLRSDVADYYDARLSDRFREMMHIVNFSNDPSFRTVGAAEKQVVEKSK